MSRARRTDKGQERAEQLLDAGLAAVAAKPAHEVLPSRADTLRATHGDATGLGPASAGSFRNLFRTVEGFHHRLVKERLLTTHPAVPETVGLLEEAARAMAAGETVNVADRLARIARVNLEVNLAETESERGRMQCLVAALAPGGEFVAEALREDFDEFTREFAAVYDQILDAWGMKLRAPFDTEALAVLLAAIANGLTMRHLVDPDAVDLELFQHTVVALILLVVARPDDDRSIPQLIEETFPQPQRAHTDRTGSKSAVDRA